MWQLSTPQASTRRALFDGGRYTLSLDAARPSDGAILKLGADETIAPALWAWRPERDEPPKLADAYVRGADLVLDYGPQAAFPFHTQVYWRCSPPTPEQAASVSLMISVRTHKLDTHPVYEITSRYAASRVKGLRAVAGREGVAGLLATSPSRGWSVVEAIAPGDLPSGAEPELASAADGATTGWRLFDLFMEKGVIRRARLSLAVVGRAISPDEGAAVAEQLRSAPTPLST